MSNELPRTYVPFKDWKRPSKQTEYTERTPLLSPDGELLVKGWARHNVFDYERSFSKPNKRKKEWDFYQLGNKDYSVQISFANISVGGYASAMSGPAMAVAIGYALQAPPLVLFSLTCVGWAANKLGGAGGPLAVLLISIIAAECGKAVSKETKIDILVTPLVTIFVGVTLSALWENSANSLGFTDLFQVFIAVIFYGQLAALGANLDTAPFLVRSKAKCLDFDAALPPEERRDSEMRLSRAFPRLTLLTPGYSLIGQVQSGELGEPKARGAKAAQRAAAVAQLPVV